MIYEKLFLDKIKEVFVREETTVKLKQYQKDGLRSLYKQYSKKRPGFILNHPFNAGKRTQVAVFLTAVKHLLENPVLIVSSNVEKWRAVFCCWAEDISDILFNSDKLTSNATILVTDLNEAAAIGRTEWGMVVVDDTECSVKLFRPLKGLKAAFKIVLTSVDLKKNYKTFSTIYEWIEPAEKVALEKFSRQLQAATNELERLVLLDWYFQDKVLRRSGVGCVSDTVVEHEPGATKNIPSRAKPISKKNKDATGTKVKRSKPKPVDEKPSEPLRDTIDFEFDTMSAPNASNTFRENKEVGTDNVTEEVDSTIDVIGKTNETSTFKENKRKRVRVIESDEESDGGENTRTNNLIEQTIKDKVTNENEVNVIAKDYETKDSIKIKINSAKNVMPLFPFEMEEDSEDVNVTACDMNCLSSQQNIDEISPNFPYHGTDNVNLFNSERIDNEIVTNGESKSNEIENIEMKECKALSIEDELNEMKQNKESTNDVHINEMKETEEISPEKSVRDMFSQKNDSKLDDKIKAMEENILNNFKGSILDCLF